MAQRVADRRFGDAERFGDGNDLVQVAPVGRIRQLFAAAQIHLPVGECGQRALGQQCRQWQVAPAARIAQRGEAAQVALRQDAPDLQRAFQRGLLRVGQGQRPAGEDGGGRGLHLDDRLAQGFEDGEALARRQLVAVQQVELAQQYRLRQRNIRQRHPRQPGGAFGGVEEGGLLLGPGGGRRRLGGGRAWCVGGDAARWRFCEVGGSADGRGHIDLLVIPLPWGAGFGAL